MALPCEVVHDTRGRLRLRVPGLRSRRNVREGLVALLRERPGVHAVRAAPACDSLTVRYDHRQCTADSLLQALATCDPASLAARPALTTGRPSPPPESRRQLFVSAAAAAVAAAGGNPLSLLATPWLLALSARPVFARAYESIARRRKLNVDVLDASASVAMVLRGQFAPAALMLGLVNLADYIRDATVGQSRRAISSILDYQVSLAWVVRHRRKVRVPVADLQAGEVVAIYPGEYIPVDGTVTAGKALVDQQTLTGESVPVLKSVGDTVYAATVVRDGKLSVCAGRVGEDTKAATIVRLVDDAPARETKIQDYAERWADALVPPVMAGAGSSLLLTGSLERTASLLVVDYGTGIRVAAPTTVLASMTKAARTGILIKGGRHLERLAAVDAIVFDKTGTLTLGDMRVVATVPLAAGPEEVLCLAAAAEQRFTHPVAAAVLRAAQARGLTIPEREASEYCIGLGVQADVAGRCVLVGNSRFLCDRGVRLRREVTRELRELEARAVSPLCVAADDRVIGLLGVADVLRPEAAEVVHSLRARGVREVSMVTGDRPSVAAQAAAEAGISHYLAEAFPEEKVAFVKQLQAAGCRVAVVGDGINDSPALAQADVGIAVDGGTDVARETASVVFVNGGLWKLPAAIDIARESVGLIEQNWKLISVPNTLALALAAAGVLGPVGTTLISNGSGILAALNSLRPLLPPRRSTLARL